MTLKVVRIGADVSSALKGPKEPEDTHSHAVKAASGATVSTTIATRAVSTDAAHSAIRSTRHSYSFNTEKIKDIKEAEKTAHDLSEHIGSDQQVASEAHANLSSVSAREHFTENT